MSVSLLSMRRGAQPPPQSPERAMLAERIATRDAARARLAGLRDVADRAMRNIWAMQEASETAARAVEDARTADARAATDALLAGTPTPPATLSAARAALTLAEDAQAAATSARDSLTAEVAELERGEAIRENRVATAAVAVVRAEAAGAIQALIAEIDALHQQVVDKGIALRGLILAGIIEERGADAIPNVMELNNRMAFPAASWSIARIASPSPTTAIWEAAIAALKADATAPLPT